jgi:protein phosphatase
MGVAYGITDTGLFRLANEDNFLIDEELSLVIVADGMGGHEAGALASAEAIRALREFVRTSCNAILHKQNDSKACKYNIGNQARQERRMKGEPAGEFLRAEVRHTLLDAVTFANEHLFSHNIASHNPEGQGMGTTITGIWQFHDGGPLTVFHVGDSRLYRYRTSGLVALTRDQTLYQNAIDAGMRSNLPPQNLLWQAVGPHSAINPEIRTHRIEPGDVYLLCSDGLHGSVPHKAIESIMRNTTQNNLDQACANLIALAKAYGSKDNITAILINCNK